MALEFKVFRPISVATAFRRRFDAFHVACRKMRRSVIGHLLVFLRLRRVRTVPAPCRARVFLPLTRFAACYLRISVMRPLPEGGERHKSPRVV